MSRAHLRSIEPEQVPTPKPSAFVVVSADARLRMAELAAKMRTAERAFVGPFTTVAARVQAIQALDELARDLPATRLAVIG